MKSQSFPDYTADWETFRCIVSIPFKGAMCRVSSDCHIYDDREDEVEDDDWFKTEHGKVRAVLDEEEPLKLEDIGKDSSPIKPLPGSVFEAFSVMKKTAKRRRMEAPVTPNLVTTITTSPSPAKIGPAHRPVKVRKKVDFSDDEEIFVGHTKRKSLLVKQKAQTFEEMFE